MPTRGIPHVPQYKYTVVFEPAEEGGYIVTVPALPGLIIEANNLEDGRMIAKDAILGYLESLVKHGEEIPLEAGAATLERIAVTL